MENQKSNWWIEEYKKYHREKMITVTVELSNFTNDI